MELLAPELQDLTVLRRLIFAVVYLPKDLPQYWSVVGKFASQGGKDLEPEIVRLAVENLRLLNEQAFVTDKQLADEIHALQTMPEVGTPLGVVLISSKTRCGLCDGKLLIRYDRACQITVYTESFGTIVGTHYHKYCQNYRRDCTFRQHYGYSSRTINGQHVCLYDPDWKDHKYIISTQETAFELRMIEKYDNDLLLGQISYSQKAEIYNHNNGYPVPYKQCSTLDKGELPNRLDDDVLNQRIRLDRRRFESAHLKYAMLSIQKCYPTLSTLSITVTGEIKETMLSFTPAFYQAFCKKYSNHRCHFPGCINTLVLDGNMKNCREICFAKDAGMVSYPGLPGHIKTGCTASPAYKSRYCKNHQTRVCQTAIHQAQNDSNVTNSCDGVIEVLLAKKETRGSKYYQVLWLGKSNVEVTWEPESSLPQEIIKEFENNLTNEVSEEKMSRYGYDCNTLVVESKMDTIQSNKKPKIERPVIQESEGAIIDQEPARLQCNTQKDRHGRLNFRTAGILAGMRPCGIILFVSELFIAESLSQVYGCLHNYYRLFPDAVKNIDFICYDDACHLTKFSKNSIRANLTSQSEMLAGTHMVVDKMHMKGHIDAWCKENCNADKFEALKKVDTEVCEQVFSWLSRYSHITKKMSQHTFIFFILYLCDLHNRYEELKLIRTGFLVKTGAAQL